MSQPLADYPDAAWRPNQRRYAELVLGAATADAPARVGLEGPCGCGKSLGYLRPLLAPQAPPSVVLSTTRAHLRQLERTLEEHFPDGDWAVLRGRAYYSCCGQGGRKPSPKLKGRHPVHGEDHDPADAWVEPDTSDLEEAKARSADASRIAVGLKKAANRAREKVTNAAGSEKDRLEKLAVHAEKIARDAIEKEKRLAKIVLDLSRASSKQCPLGEKCEYQQAILACGEAKIVVQCTIGHLYRRRYWSQIELGPNAKAAAVALDAARKNIISREVVVLDEAHEYLDVRRSFETAELELWPSLIPGWDVLDRARMRGTYRAGSLLISDGPGAVRLRGLLRTALNALKTDEAFARLAGNDRALSGEARDEAKRKWLEKVDARLELLDRVDSPGEGPVPVLSVQWPSGAGGSPKLICEPLYANVGEQLARCEVFTSATLRPVAGLLKIPSQNVVAFPEIFDWAGSVRLKPIADPAPSNRRNEPLDAELIERLYRAPGRPVTILLGFSRAHCRAMTQRIAGRPGVLIQGADDRSLDDLVDAARVPPRGGEPAPLLVTYGGWVGTDLPGEKWLILGSVPKAPISPVHEARAARGGGSPWGDREKLASERLRLAQGLGRLLRTPEDRGVLIWCHRRAAQDLGMSATTGRVSA